VNNEVKVYINDVESLDFTFEESSKSVIFNKGSIPTAGSQIKVIYTVLD
jgi:hypothetical protein